MTLFLARAPLRLPALSRLAAERGWMQAWGFDEGRALHHLLSECFGPRALQPFRLLAPRGAGVASLYAYGAQDADALRATAREIALPETRAVIDPARLETKAMPDRWPAGKRVGFDLLTRPTRRLAAPAGGFTRGAEIDAFLVHALRANPQGPPEAPDPGASRTAVYLDWLEERLAPAARLDRAATRLAHLRRRRVARGGRASEGPEAVFHGTLEIVDPARFSDLLIRGVGRHRAYGCAMLLLRAPGRPPPER